MKSPARRLAYAAVIAAACFWGMGFVLGKIALETMPVGAMLAWRFIAATAVIVPILVARPLRPTLRQAALLVVAAIVFVPVQFLIQFEGLARTSVAHAALVVAVLPALLALASLLFVRNGARPNWLAIAAAAAGAALVVARPGGHASIAGDLLVLASLLAGVAWVILCDRLHERLDALASTSWMLAIGTLILLAFESAVAPHALLAHYPPGAWIATIAIGVLMALASLLWTAGLKHVPVADAGVFVNVEPVIGALAGVAIFGDALTPQSLLGGALIVASAVAVARSGRKKKAAAQRAAA